MTLVKSENRLEGRERKREIIREKRISKSHTEINTWSKKWLFWRMTQADLKLCDWDVLIVLSLYLLNEIFNDFVLSYAFISIALLITFVANRIIILFQVQYFAATASAAVATLLSITWCAHWAHFSMLEAVDKMREKSKESTVHVQHTGSQLP